MNLLFMDVETTGLDPLYHDIIDICLVETDREGKEIKRFSSKIVPSVNGIRRANPKALEVNGYSYEGWKNAKEVPDALNKINELWKEREKLIPVGWNTPFDISFIGEAFKHLSRRFYHHSLDLMSMYWGMIFDMPERPSLSKTYKEYFNREMKNAHTAEGDVNAYLDLYRAYMAVAKEYEDQFGKP